MTKVYLVCAQSCKQDGILDINSKKLLVEAFTNYKLAWKCAKYYNQEWELGIKRNADFKVERIKYYYVQTMNINRNDFSKLPY